jgi:hypothetical protein
MPYIGKSPTGSGVRTRYYFTATGGETSLSGADDGGKTLTFSDGEYVDVYLNGIALVAGTDYGTATANTISGLAALSTNDIVEVVVYDIYNVAKINSEAVRTRHYYTATGGETSIGTAQIPGLSFPGGTEIEVSLNGISLVAGTDYNTTAANTVGGLSALSAGNVIEIIIYDKFQLADTVSKAQGGTFSGAITANSGLNVGTIKEATGTTTAMTIDSSGQVLLSAIPYIRMKSTGTVSVNLSTSLAVPFNNVIASRGITLNTSTYKFQVPVTGLYHFSGAVRWNRAASTYVWWRVDDGTGTAVQDSSLVLNGMHNATGNTFVTSAGAFLCPLTASTDYQISLGDGSTSTAVVESNQTFMAIYLVGAS